MSQKNTFKIAHEHQQWLRFIEQLKTNINKIQKQLTQLAGDQKNIDALKKVEHFQNQLIVQRNNIDELEQKIHLHIDRFHAEAEKRTQEPASPLEEEHRKIKAYSEDLLKTMQKLDDEFSRHFQL